MALHFRVLALACVFLAACASAPVDDPVPAAGISLQPGAAAALSRTVTLRFDRIADSRCPSNVKCVWAGSVAYHFTLGAIKGNEQFKLERGELFDSAMLKGLRIALGEPAPGPVQALGMPPLPHPVSLTISRY